MNAKTAAVIAFVASAALLAAATAFILSLRRNDALAVAPASSPSAVVIEAGPPEPAPEIRGRILNADGASVEGATVRLVSAAAPYRVYQETKTDRAGAFFFAHVGGWRVRVVADHGSDGVVTSAELRVTSEESLELTLVLSPAGAVRGVVVDAQGRPVAGAVVSVDGLPWIVSASSDAQGAFVLTTVPDEATGLVAVARGFRTAHASIAAREQDRELVVRIVLTAANPVAGRVEDDAGNPISASVVACEDTAAEARVQSGADGAFELPPSAIGCNAVAEHLEFAASPPQPVVEGRRLVLRLGAGGAIQGVVVDESGAVVTPFVVGIESFTPIRGRGGERHGSHNFDDPGGAFRWDKLAPGSYVLTASAAGKPPSRSASIDVQAGATTSGVRIVLAKGGVLVGRVSEPGGAAVAGADLHFDAVSGVLESKASATTDGAGRYRLDGAPEGPLTVRVHKDGYRSKLVSGLRVASGATLQQDIVLSPFDGGGSMEFGGIGAGLGRNGDALVFQSVFPDDPAARAGLRPGDRILSIDGDSTEGMSLADALQRIRGEPGTAVGVSAFRPETGETVNLTVVRETVVH
jgi:hypothetical protein